MEKYAMYLRKSRADLELEALGEGETLARHQKILTDLAARHEISMDQVVIYKEMVSGDSLSDRPEAQRLLRDVYAKKYKAVLVVEVERLARGNTKDQGEVADAFQYGKTHIITPAKVYDPDNEFDQEYFEFGLFMSRREYKTIRRRLIAGKDQSAAEGNYLPSRRLFGYKIVRRSKKERTLEIIPEETALVQDIFNWFAYEGWSLRKIALKLTAMGIPTIMNKPEWSEQTIRDMLENQTYLGKIVWNQQSTIKVFDPKTGQAVKKRVKNPESEWLIYEGKHPAIISQEVFDAARERRSLVAPVNYDYEMINPLCGLLKCASCGKSIFYQRYADRRHRYSHPVQKKCQKKSIVADTLIEGFVETMRQYIADFEIKMENDNDQTELIRHQEQIRLMEVEMAKLEAKKQRLFESWEADDGMYTRDEFIERKQMYTRRIDLLKNEIEESKKNVPAPVDYAEQIKTLHSLIACIQDKTTSAEEKNLFLKRFIARIDYDVIDHGIGKSQPVLTIHLK